MSDPHSSEPDSGEPRSGEPRRGDPRSSERVRRHVIVRGYVQGVFFRDSTRREARRRGVAGWVRNRADGAVEAVFEGGAAEVEALVEFCRHGPRGADVTDVEVVSEPVEGVAGFEVR